MYELMEAKICPGIYRMGYAHIKYYDIEFMVDICLYKDQCLWLRMPEFWEVRAVKKRLLWWSDKNKSDQFQVLMLKQIFDKTGFTLEKAIDLRRELVAKRKLLTQQKNKLTLEKESSKG